MSKQDDMESRKNLAKMLDDPRLKRIEIAERLGREEYRVRKTISIPTVRYLAIGYIMEEVRKIGLDKVCRIRFLSDVPSCPDCNGTGQYVGLFEISPCRRCYP